MKLLHPFMPFVTSEIYSNLVQYDDKELMVSKWPEMKEEFVFEIRNIRASKNIHPSKKADLIFVTKNYKEDLEKAKEFILKLGFGKDMKVQQEKSGITNDSIQILIDGIELYMPLEGLIDKAEEEKRKAEEQKRLEQEILRCEKMLSNPGFISKAPEAKVNEERAKLEKYKSMLEKL